MGARKRWIMLVLVAALGAAGAGTAHATGEGLGWSAPLFLSSPGATGLAPSLAVLDDGTAVAGWAENAGSGYFPVIASRPVAANWSTPSPISSGAIDPPSTYSFGPRMAFTHDGRFVAAWLAGNGETISGATGTIAAGSPPAYVPNTIVSWTGIAGRHLSLIYTPRVLMTPDGTGVVAYPFYDSVGQEWAGINAITGAAPAITATEAPQTYIPSYVELGGSNTDDSAQLPPVALAPPTANGLGSSNATEALITISPSYSSTQCGQPSVPAETALLYTTSNPSSWPAADSCQVLPFHGPGEQVAVLSTGKVIVTAPSGDGKLMLWEQGDVTPRTIDPAIGPLLDKTAIAPFSDGTATIVYRALGADGNLEIRQVTIDSTGGVSEPQTLSASNGSASEAPQVAYAPDGTTYVVWSQTEYPGPGSAATGVFASYRLPGGDFPATPQTVISGLTNSHRAQIAVGPDGSVTLVAQINDGSGSRIAAFTHANPAAPKNTEPPQTSAPNGTNAGATITCSTGTWTASPTSYLFEWLVDGKSLGPGAASSSHVITAAELGHQLSCRVTASNAAGSGQATSEAIVPGNGSGGGPGPGGPGSPSASKIKAHGDSASADVSCPSGGGSCPVTLQLTAASGHKARDSKVTVVGSTSAVVRPGQHRTVKVGLNHMGKKLLRAHGKLRVKLVVRSGKQLVATKSLVLRRPAKKHRG